MGYPPIIIRLPCRLMPTRNLFILGVAEPGLLVLFCHLSWYEICGKYVSVVSWYRGQVVKVCLCDVLVGQVVKNVAPFTQNFVRSLYSAPLCAVCQILSQWDQRFSRYAGYNLSEHRWHVVNQGVQGIRDPLGQGLFFLWKYQLVSILGVVRPEQPRKSLTTSRN